ncbi:HD-GYP domain-containing protein [Tumebacillus sp. DT12]|uniref:HD-GYP domain-containing protein n=1 Tax=Tumebacillus lacus TaxID=2995335 RepID=A0ABT3X0U6_9BACL|nr:HD-GYP domain-containing protein [Tumebacillus lacus]MCX7570530.1 HD-GYP domain-containing protein [Tumebacillus lacus]
MQSGDSHKGKSMCLQDLGEDLNAYFRSLQDKDVPTMLHSKDVARCAELLAMELELSVEVRKELCAAGMFHDIGKLLIPDLVLKKPGRLTDTEYELMKRHVVYSGEILASHFTGDTMRQAVICHHERYDGRGYPFGLKGTDIPLPGRILAIADAYSAMTLDRAYQRRKSVAESLAEIRRCAGVQFDPELAERFCQVIERQSV